MAYISPLNTHRHLDFPNYPPWTIPNSFYVESDTEVLRGTSDSERDEDLLENRTSLSKNSVKIHCFSEDQWTVIIKIKSVIFHVISSQVWEHLKSWKETEFWRNLDLRTKPPSQHESTEEKNETVQKKSYHKDGEVLRRILMSLFYIPPSTPFHIKITPNRLTLDRKNGRLNRSNTFRLRKKSSRPSPTPKIQILRGRY